MSCKKQLAKRKNTKLTQNLEYMLQKYVPGREMQSSTKALDGLSSFTFHAPVECSHVMQHPRRVVLQKERRWEIIKLCKCMWWQQNISNLTQNNLTWFLFMICSKIDDYNFIVYLIVLYFTTTIKLVPTQTILQENINKNTNRSKKYYRKQC